MSPPITMKPFGRAPDGRPVEAYTLTNVHGMSVCILTYGGTVQSLRAAGRDGDLDDVVLGYDELERYFDSPRYFGALIGRYANRLAGGRFSIDGRDYQVTRNEGENSLHGGVEGFDKRLWTARAQETRVGARLTLNLLSPDGDQGFPGELAVQVAYELTRANELRLDFQATTTAPTVINLTNHSYWNLGGLGGRHARDHELQVFAEAYTPVDEALLPTGEIAPVADTPYDFREPRLLTVDLDHNFVLRPKGRGALAPAARLHHPGAGRTLQIDTTEPGLQVFTGFGGVALETQHFPDAPNHPNFIPALLRPGVIWKSTTVFKLSA